MGQALGVASGLAEAVAQAGDFQQGLATDLAVFTGEQARTRFNLGLVGNQQIGNPVELGGARGIRQRRPGGEGVVRCPDGVVHIALGTGGYMAHQLARTRRVVQRIGATIRCRSGSAVDVELGGDCGWCHGGLHAFAIAEWVRAASPS